MKLTRAELDFLAAWAREEWEEGCYQRPAHRLQLAHSVPAAHFIPFIKAWTRSESKKDQDIVRASANPAPDWPWASVEEFLARLEQARGEQTNRSARAS